MQEQAINVDDLSGCKHPETPDYCDETCVCWCDGCQERFEADWAIQTVAKGLCSACGVPKEIRSMDDLVHTERYHFFMPCEDCKGVLGVFLQTQGICSMCRGLAREFCPKCSPGQKEETQ